ncbi:MAG: DUF5010 domain-containing protein [Kiritimatiellaeota bacterium]|nr:DUF5010 domain-containing protein [Kiritimatiellota bacterium]
MRTIAAVGAATAFFCLTAGAAAPEKTLIEWRFDRDGDLRGWGVPNHISELRAAGGAMKGRIMNWDPFVRGPRFQIPASPWQRIDIRLKTDCGGDAEFFWTNTTEGKYGGFSPGKESHFTVLGDNQWHVYRVYPFWQTEKKIVLLRLDLPRPPEQDYGKKTFEVSWIRVVDMGEPAASARTAWRFPRDASEFSPLEGARARAVAEGLEIVTSPKPVHGVRSRMLRLPAAAGYWVSVEMSVDRGQRAVLRWASSGARGVTERAFPIRADGKFHTYNVDMAASANWRDDIYFIEFTPSTMPGARAVVRSLMTASEPQGPPDVEITYAGLADAINRAGKRLKVTVYMLNHGGANADALRISQLRLPPGVRVDEPGEAWRKLSVAEPFEPLIHRFHVRADRPVSGEMSVALRGPGAPAAPYRGRIEVLPAVHVPRARYVPEPRPVVSDYEIGAYYFPGWSSAVRWDPILRRAPERKPVLGWYDEANPECVDWQIKWAVENGIGFFMVDWYWNAGSRHLEHWVKAFEKARYRRFLKWCVMWANHNRRGSHSEEDQRAVTRYWLAHCFNMPEYYRIDGKPVVIIWSVANMDRDMAGKGGAARLLEISQEEARKAGLDGIYFIAMKWPEATVDAGLLQRLKDDGFSMTTIYHYMGHGGKAQDPGAYPFDLVARASYPFWRERLEADILPFMPAISTGWDSRPWHGDRARVVYGRTVPLFRRICEDAKRFADETGIKRLALGPLNEWGEGSYIEPCKEFGFGMYEAIRDVFGKKPKGGWPVNLAPADVGLGPYDLEVESLKKRTVWDFSDGPQGWGPLMGVTDFKAGKGEITCTTVSRDPAIGTSVARVRARRYPYALIRLRLDKHAGEPDGAQLFWRASSAAITEGTSYRFEVVNDGRYHDYLLPLAETGRWHGRITQFRFDPCSRAGAKVAVAEFRLLEKKPAQAR